MNTQLTTAHTGSRLWMLGSILQSGKVWEDVASPRAATCACRAFVLQEQCVYECVADTGLSLWLDEAATVDHMSSYSAAFQTKCFLLLMLTCTIPSLPVS